ncbi:hypothetical protein QFC19_005121 [Naganishia cerealis]|uniref:Uncharacterized protein n=1 Tax=Naganishia cerealis TaxID=610337 RepID=A0ACC2VPW2_9TREE|nr:hypothetical protein QFC19_005121 [Naganishia cerealis]
MNPSLVGSIYQATDEVAGLLTIIYSYAVVGIPGMSWGPVPWLFPPEIMPMPFRAKGVSLSTAANWLFNAGIFISGYLAIRLISDLMGWRLYPMHAGFCLISLITVYFVYPETAGVPLEEMDALFGDESNEKGDEDDDNDDGEDDDSSYTAGSRTPGSSLRSASPSSFRRNSSTPLVGSGGGPVGMMKRMFINMRKKETGTGAYNQLQH